MNDSLWLGDIAWPDDTETEGWSTYLSRVKLPSLEKHVGAIVDAFEDFMPDIGAEFFASEKRGREDPWSQALGALDSCCPDTQW